MNLFTRWLLLILIVAAAPSLSGQDSTAIKYNPKLLLGRWQLSQTFNMGAYHKVVKEDFNDVIELKPGHRYREEVYYESNHWILEGRWNLNSKTKILSFTDRTYTMGKLEDHPQDVHLNLTQLNKEFLAGSGTEKGRLVKVAYTRIR